MQVGEFFVKLGVTGADVATKSVKSATGAMSSLRETSLATKAAILAVFYGLQRITGTAGERGMELKQFADATGLSTDKLQRWQYAARQYGVAGSEVVGVIKSIQKAMLDMQMGKGAPEGIGLLANAVGFDTAKARDAFYVMDKLQQFAQSGVSADVAGAVLRSFGVADSMLAFFRKNQVDIDKISSSMIISPKTIDQLAKVDVMYANVYAKFQRTMERLTAKHGIGIIAGMDKAASQLLLVIDRLATLADKLRIFEIITEAFKGWAMILELVTGLLGDLDRKTGKKKDWDPVKDIKDGFKSILDLVLPTDKLANYMAGNGFSTPETPKPLLAKLPKVTQQNIQPIQKTNNTTVHQVNNFHGVKGASDALELLRRQTNAAVDQSPAKAQVN
jgi:hypothetical protein